VDWVASLKEFSENRTDIEVLPTWVSPRMTIFITHTIETNNSISQFDIWDTAGQERFKALGSLYYKNAKASIVAYDITNYNSFKRAKEWIVELKENVEDNV